MIAWAVLMMPSLVIGTAILSGVKADCFDRVGDRLVVAVWLGVVILAISLLAVSLILPLSPLVGVIVTISLTGLALRLGKTKAEMITLCSSLSRGWILGFITLELGIAAFTSQNINWHDTGLYHFQVIQWLSQFGAVPGLALIHHRFGFTSSWFALAAPFNTGVFEARIGAVTGGAAFFLISWHSLISVARILKNKERFEDWFLVTSSFLCLPILAWIGMPVSPSPDLPNIILTVVVAWTIVSISSKRITLSPDKNPHSATRIIPLILSAGAVTIKVSAFPLLFVSWFFYICGKRFSLRHIFLSSTISILLILPMLGFGIVTSGCPLYPSSFMCLDLPWSVGKENANNVSKIIQNWARWSGPTPDHATSWNWFIYWVKESPSYFFNKQTAVLLISSILSIPGIFITSNKHQVQNRNYILALGLSGMIFMMFMAPTLRFGLGYLIILPAFSIALKCHQKSPQTITITLGLFGILTALFGWHKIGFIQITMSLTLYLFIALSQGKIKPNFFLPILLLFLMITPAKSYLISFSNTQKLEFHFFLPVKMQSPTKLVSKTVNNINIVKPGRGDQCWAAELLCTPETPKNIKLRIPEQGIGAGFRHNSNQQSTEEREGKSGG